MLAIKDRRQRSELHLLGSFALHAPSGETIALPTRKAEALLAYLVSTAPSLHTRDKLAALLWGNLGEEQARQNLRQTLFTLRRLIPGGDRVIHTDGDKVGLDTTTLDIDLLEFRDLATQSDPQLLARTAQLYRGDLLDGLAIDEEDFNAWLITERERLRELAIEAQTRLMNSLAAADKVDAAIQAALRVVALEPSREAAHRALMRLYLQSGRRDAALRQYYACVDALRQLELEPEAETQKLHDEIRGGTPREEKSGSEAARRLSILMIEDNPLNRVLVAAMLRDDERFELSAAEDAPQALLMLGNQAYDLILLDIALPTLDGFTLLEAIRKHGIETPTIMLTAFASEEYEVRGLQLGAADYLVKPVQKARLVARIEKVLRDKLPGA